MSSNQFLLRLLLNADGDLDSIHILAKIPLSLPVWVCRPRNEFSARYSGEAGRTLGQKHPTRPLILSLRVWANHRPGWGMLTNQRSGHCDTLTPGIISHCWPRPQLPLLLLRRLQILLSTPEFSTWTKYFVLAQTSISSSAAAGWLRHKAGQSLLDDYNTLPYRGHKLQILFVPPIKCQHSVMHGPRPGRGELPSSLWRSGQCWHGWWGPLSWLMAHCSFTAQMLDAWTKWRERLKKILILLQRISR